MTLVLRHSVGAHDRGQRAVARRERGYSGTQPDSLCGTRSFRDQSDGRARRGKTALLETTIASWRDSGRIAVIEGDQATDRDSARIRSAGATAYQVETGLGCHLDAAQIHRTLHHLELTRGGVLFIENVGNLPFELDEWTDYVRAVNPHARIIKASAMSADGISEWLSLLGSLRVTFLCASEKSA